MMCNWRNTRRKYDVTEFIEIMNIVTAIIYIIVAIKFSFLSFSLRHLRRLLSPCVDLKISLVVFDVL
jgi:hypothetical protein